ncbi:Vesicle transport v-SNARE 12 [Hondaea fermentalgiana]|uniref:Vesicle transport v-SNARE 12 n=1 Tax=Hondaea fermentalgiana TaxID=2315210 RepID=A0A2R5G979_9STRA|nr:Vesicle transport v-SNARE 12 [Hondaea fermentalgiana]|eukprot:GBG24621.1 Vesicle transport v-SNARE 12 [Hondaea fermentalgiana]
MFVSYEAEFEAILEAVRDSLTQVDGLQDNPAKRRSVLKQCDLDLGQAESLIRQMNVEVRTDPSPAAHKEALKALRQEYTNVQQKTERQDLFDSRAGAGSSNEPLISYSQAAEQDRSRFSEVTARMDRSTDSLLQTRQVLSETEEVAMSISQNLEQNRATIIGAHERVTLTSGLIGGANQILRRMRQREYRRKIMLTALIVMLIFVIIMILVFALKPSSTSTSSPTASPTPAPTPL